MTPDTAQRQEALGSARRAIHRICDGWQGATTVALGVGFVSSTEGVRVKTADLSDPTADAAARVSRVLAESSEWRKETVACLGLLLRLSGQDDPGGHLDPPRQYDALCRGLDRLVDEWPVRTEDLIKRLVRLGNTAARLWPARLRPGDECEGVRVGAPKAEPVACTECGGPIGGDAADPLRRDSGLPYHKAPCYNTVRRRRQRAQERGAA